MKREKNLYMFKTDTYNTFCFAQRLVEYIVLGAIDIKTHYTNNLELALHTALILASRVDKSRVNPVFLPVQGQHLARAPHLFTKRE